MENFQNAYSAVQIQKVGVDALFAMSVSYLIIFAVHCNNLKIHKKRKTL